MPAKFAFQSILFVLGWISVLFGVIGIVTPLLPTTPFFILAGYLFSKSSPRVHSWLTGLPYAGDAIMDWERNRVIRPKAKKLAYFAIVLVIGSSMIFANIHFSLKIMLTVIGVGCITFIATRKSTP
ncbi:MAG: YbaN family protein [Flavobacteriaceae bacterium]|nr:YbaN family protein [Flavobacteriaceae bacterium]